MSFNLAEAVMEFTSGTESNWNNFTLPIPKDVVIFTTDTQVFKKGTGLLRFHELPVAASIQGIIEGGQNILNVLTTLLVGDEGKIIIIDNEVYKPSSTQLSSVLTAITEITNKDILQDADLDMVGSMFNMVGAVSSVDDGKLVITNSFKMVPGENPEDINVEVQSNPLYIRNYGIYTTKDGDDKPVWLYGNTSYYMRSECGHDSVDIDDLSISLVSDDPTNITIEDLGRGLFKITTDTYQYNDVVKFTIAVNYNAEIVSKVFNFVVLGSEGAGAYGVSLLSSVYGGTIVDTFNAVTTDSSDNIICAGYTTSEGVGGDEALVVKLDSNLNVLVRKVYGGLLNDQFRSVTTDSSDNIICAGNTSSEGTGSASALVVKFDSNLNILTRKVYSGTLTSYFISSTIDSLDNVIAVGHTNSEGAGGYEALIVRFDTNLNILSRKVYGGTVTDTFYSVVVDSVNNIICTGQTASEGPGLLSALIVKFDANLNILARKVYGGAGEDDFRYVKIDSSDNIICAGYTYSEGTNGNAALVVKFDANLNILARKIYSGINPSSFFGITIDSLNNIICAGFTSSEGAGGYDGLVVKFDSNLNILARKVYGGTEDDRFRAVTTDSSDNIICVGSTVSEGAGEYDALVLKLPSDIPSGTFVGTVLTGMTLRDSNLILADSNLTLANSNLTLANSNLTLANSTLTLADSNLPFYEIDDFGMGGFIFRDILTAVYGGTGEEIFWKAKVDSSDNIIAVGHTDSEGAGGSDALVVKFDNNLNILARKVYGGMIGDDRFYNLTIDSTNNIIAVGHTNSEGAGDYDSLIIKFDSNLNILARKVYGGTGPEYFRDACVDSFGNIIIAGQTHPFPESNWNGMVVKFDSNLNILIKKNYGGVMHDFFYGIAVDSANNIICAGYTTSEGAGSYDALVVKFDSNLSILARKIYGGSGDEYFYGVAVDSLDNIIIAGQTQSEGAGGNDALVVKFDPNLNVLARKVYGGTGDDVLFDVMTDSIDNIIITGYTSSEGVGSNSALVIKFDPNLNILSGKVYGGTNGDYFYGVTVDSSDNIVCVGFTASEGIGGNDALVLKLPSDIPSGTFVGTVLSGLTLQDSNLTLIDSVATISNSTLTLSDSTYTSANSNLTLANSNLTLEKDIINP